MQKVSRARKVYFSAIVLMSTIMLMTLSIPQVAAHTQTYSEDFKTNNHIVSTATNVSGIGSGVVSIPHQKIKLVSSTTPSTKGDLLVDGNIMYLAGTALYIYDISNYFNPELITSLPFTGFDASYWGSLALEKNILYVPTTYGFLAIVNVTDPENPEMILKFDSMSGGNSPVDVYVVDDVAFIPAAVDGLQLWNVSDPAHPTSIANYTDQIFTARSVTVQGNYAFIGESNWLHVVNITDIHHPTFVARVGPYSVGNRVQYLGDDLVATSWGIFDVSNVSDPTLVCDGVSSGNGCYKQGDIFIAVGNQGPVFWDISDMSNTHLLSWSNDYNGCSGLYVNGDYLITAAQNGLHLQIYRFREDGKCYWDSYESFATVESDVVYTCTNDQYIYRTMIHVNDSIPTGTDVTYSVTADNGTWWVELTPDVDTALHSFIGRNLKWKAELSTTNASVTPTLSNISISCRVFLRDPTPTGPQDLDVLNESTPQFKWQGRDGAQRYLLQIDTSVNFDSPDLINITTTNDGTSYTLQTPLADGQWYWRVAAIDSEGDIGIFSQQVVFTIDTGAGTNTGTTLNIFDLETMLPYLLAGAAAVAIVVIVIVVRKRGT